MSCHWLHCNAEALMRNERALALDPHNDRLLECRNRYLYALAEQEEEPGQVEAQQAHID